MRKLAVVALVAGLAILAAPQIQAAPVPAAQNWLRLSLQSMEPGVVSANDTSVTLMGKITNISDRRISQITARLQLGDALTSGADARTALRPTAGYAHSDTVFRPVTESLAPGASALFSVSEPLQGSESLRITKTGVYPLMINVQGVPDFSTGYRLVVGTMLLPVLGAAGTQAPQAPTPSDLTVLWPLVDQRPREVGSAGNQIVLADDTLAKSLAPGGRLFGLLNAAQQAADSDPALLSSLCFAVDPDLLDTVTNMAAGYRVRTGNTTVAGRGADAAALWLSTLKNLTSGHCALVLPYADTDLAALEHAGGTGLLQLALNQSTAYASLLGAAPLPNVVWPLDNALDTATLSAISGFGVHTVLLDPGSVTPKAGTRPVALAGFTGAAAPKVVPIDPVVTGAMAPRTDEPNVDETGISVQDGLAATIYQTAFGGSAGAPVLIAPPRRWSPDVTQATQFLNGVASLLAGHYATATSLNDAVRAAPTGPPATLNYPSAVRNAEVSHSVAADAVAADAQQRDVRGAMSRDHTRPTPVQPAELITPMELGLLRSVSGAWRGGSGGAGTALADANAQFQNLLDEVSVVQPSLPILLGSKNSRLPVTVNNKLPVDIAVRVDLSGEPGLPSTGVEDLIPAGAGITVFIPTTVTRSGRFSAFATVRTIGGTPFGNQARLELVSSAYGTIIVIVTAIAFGLLVLLSGRRIYRRVRASHAAAAAQQEPGQETVGALVGVGEPADRSEQQEPDQR